ncbi:serine protease, partial [Streptomyces sp. NPDC058157]
MSDEVTAGAGSAGAAPWGTAEHPGGADRPAAAPAEPVELVTIRDAAGRARGSGFVADDRGTVLTGHEAVEGLDRVVLHAAGGRTWRTEGAEVTLLPELGLALVPSDGLGVRPLPVAGGGTIPSGTYVRIPARGWRQARVLAAGAEAGYTAAGRRLVLPATVELAIGTDGRDALRLGGEACGGPVLDAETGAVLAVLGTALTVERRSGTFAVPLRAAAATSPAGPLAALLERNGATVPCYGDELNLAGALELTATTVGSAFPPGLLAGPEPVARPALAAGLAAFTAGQDLVLGLVGDPGTGRTTALAALAADRARGPRPAPTLWLRGADLRADDTSLADAVARALAEAVRIVTAGGAPTGAAAPEPAAAGTAERVARLAGAAGRALLVVLDAPEEMPPALAHRLAPWTVSTAAWLCGTGARLVVAARPEHWERAGALYPAELLHTPERPARRLPPALPVGDLTPAEADTARARLGLPADAVREADARHPLTLGLLAGIRAAGATEGRPTREEVFAAHLDLLCLRAALR